MNEFDDAKNDVSVRIMDRNFTVKCPTDKVTDLHKAAKYLDTKIKEISSGADRIINRDNLLVIAALNIVGEYFQHKKDHHEHIETTNQEVSSILNMLEAALAE